jgi:DNA invertase Pin-like site-specific DNA recombinase
MANVYSYLRFSSLKQRSGTSIDRQTDYAKRWAADNGMALDESLTMRDEGLSAFHQRHVKQGALGAFLGAIAAGRIPRGSVLIVEGLDRLSRAEPILAQAQLAQIINADITVVTAADGKRYSRDILKANPMDLVYSLLVMIRAHEESETKSQRAKAALKKHCEKWQSGNQTNTGRMGKHPQWLQQRDGEWAFVPERAAAIRHMIGMFRQGWGHVRIANELLAAGMTMTAGRPNSTQIYRIIRNPALKGVKALAIDGETYELPGYYPAILNDIEFAEIQVMMEGRARTGGASIRKIPGILTGIGIASCGYCGGPMIAHNITQRARKDGGLADGNRRIACSCHATKKPCPHPHNSSIVPIERAVMAYCADQMNLSALLSGGDRQAPARARLAAAKLAAGDIETKLARITEALLAADDGVTPITFVRAARDLEAALTKARHEIQAAEREVVATSQIATPAMAEAWAALINGVTSLDEKARLMARQLVRETFSRIVIYNRGFKPATEASVIGLLLVSKSGNTRMLTIDRATGEWKSGEDLAHR